MLPILGIGALFLAAAAFFSWEVHTTALALIEGDLRRQHATAIVIERDWFGGDSEALIFDVTFTDAAGRRQANRCTVAAARRNAVHVPSVYWRTPLAAGERRRVLRLLDS